MIDNKLREIRAEVGMSVAELARRSGASRQTITAIELHGQEPCGKHLLSISAALKKDPREIFFISFVSHEEQKGKEDRFPCSI